MAKYEQRGWWSGQPAQLSRRQLLRRAAALGLSAPALSALLAACGGGSATPTSAPAAAPSPTAAATKASGAASPTAAATSQATAATPTSAPAVLKGTKLSILQASYFVPAGQDLFKNQLQQWGKENNVEVSVDFVNWPDLQPKISAAVQAGAGPDIVHLWPTWPSLYANSLVDVHDFADKLGKSQGGYFDWVLKSASVDGRWLSVPIGTSTSAQVYRISLFKQAGIDDPVNNFPDTWEDLFKVGKKLKAMGKPLGQAFGHSPGDPPSFCYPFMWAYGAMEVKEDGKTVAFNVPQFVDGMKLLIQAWKDAFDESGLSWDDSTNNRAFLAGQISWTFNGSSIYLAALKDNPSLAQDINHWIYPKGPAGRFNNLGSQSMGIMKYSKNIEGAKAFLEWWMQPEQFRAWLAAQQGYNLAPTPLYINDPYYTSDPKLKAYAEVGKYGRNLGYAGWGNQKAAEVSARYIVIDTFARAIQSGDAASAIKWGADQLQRIYGQ
ncbi:MAG: extracellular solute-binding protein [Thermorudis peleae]|nr:extracellular solute-binding protein [Thermorudis peleae]